MALEAPRNSRTVGHCGNSGGLRRRLNPSLRGPRNDDRSRERSINVTLRETETFRPSKAGAIVGSVHRGPCADKQRVKGANRTARPDHASGSSDPMCRPPLDAGDRRALCPRRAKCASQPLPQDKVGRIESSTRQWPERSEGHLLRAKRGAVEGVASWHRLERLLTF